MENNLEKEINNQEIDLSRLIKIFYRERVLILSITILATIVSVIHSVITKPVWMGSFNIVVRNQEENSNNRNILGKEIIKNPKGLLKIARNDNGTQKLILQSPSVLMPVFENAKKYYSKNGIKSDNMTFKSWSKGNVFIDFEEGTNVLTIKYKHTDKDHILETLNLISNKYQNYSRSLPQENIDKSLKYLIDQKTISNSNYLKSQKTLDEFEIENGLGNSYYTSNDNLNSALTSSGSTVELFQNNQVNTPAQRYAEQFALLEKYESQYIDLSSKLKPKSEVLKDLQLRIDNLRTALKRPSEIIIKHKELVKKASRDEIILRNIDLELELMKLEKIKASDPWKLISIPTIDKDRISPKRKQQVLVTFFLSLISGGLIAKFKEKNSGLIFELEEIKNNTPIKFLDVLYSNDLNLCLEEIKLFSNKNKISNNKKLGIVSLKPNKLKFILDKLNEFENITTINFKDKETVDKCQAILVILESGQFTYKDFIFFNKYLLLNEDKVIGWYFLDNEISK